MTKNCVAGPRLLDGFRSSIRIQCLNGFFFLFRFLFFVYYYDFFTLCDSFYVLIAYILLLVILSMIIIIQIIIITIIIVIIIIITFNRSGVATEIRQPRRERSVANSGTHSLLALLFFLLYWVIFGLQ